jgi:hypothetical protein
MKNLLITLALFTGFVRGQATHKAHVDATFTIVGANNVRSYASNAPCFVQNSGCNYTFVSGRRFKITSLFRQVADQFVSVDETGQRQDLPYDFEDIWKKDMFAREGSDVAFAQYNFTGAIPDSLVIVTARKEEGLTLCGVNIFQLLDNHWQLAGVLKAPDVLGTCDVQLKVNKVTIARNLRGFYHQLTYQNNRFEDTGNQ